MRQPCELEPLSVGVLADLEQWARMAGWTRHHVRAVAQFWERLGEPRPFRVLDLGCGLGGLLHELSDWAERGQIPVELVGIEPDAELADRARDRLGDRAQIHCLPLGRSGQGERVHLATCSLLFNRLSAPDRLTLATDLGRVAVTAYVFDVTPTIAGEVGARLIPWLTGLHHAPPQAWARTLERAPSPDELAQLVRHLPVEVVRVFPSAICTWPEPVERARVAARQAERVRYRLLDLPPGFAGVERSRRLDPPEPACD